MMSLKELDEFLTHKGFRPATPEETAVADIAVANLDMSHVESNTPKPEWPRIRELPDAEREPFSKFLTGQTLPLMEGIPMSEQDAYYPWDYENWKRNPKNRFFD